MGLSENKAEILGLLCAEGSYLDSITHYWEYKPNRLKSYFRKKRNLYIQFGNIDEKLLKHFKQLIWEEYSHSINYQKDRARISKRFIIKDLINYTMFGHLKWRVPEEIKNSNKNVKLKFIRGYFDGDGTAITMARFFSTNKQGLMEVSEIIKSLGFRFTFNGPYKRKGKKDSYTIQISRKDHKKFIEEISPISKIPKIEKTYK